MFKKSRYIGIDLGGTNIKAGMVNVETGEVTSVCNVPTNSRAGYDAVISQMARLAEDIILQSGASRSEVGGIGVGVPGAIDMDKGTTLFLTNLPGNWINVPVVDLLKQKSKLNAKLINDARAMTLAEWKFGAGKGVDIACYTLGTGIGGGLIINGKLHLGSNGNAGELGHISVDINGPDCGCGSKGCIEVFASGPAIAAMGMRAVVQGRATMIAELSEGDLNLITPSLIFEAAKAGDKIAKDIYEFAGKIIGVGIANVVIALTPNRIVVGGGVAAAGDLILDPIRRSLNERIVFLSDTHSIDVVPAQLGNNAGLIGAAVWASNS